MQGKKRTILIIAASVLLLAAIIAAIVLVIRAGTGGRLSAPTVDSLLFDSMIEQELQEPAQEQTSADPAAVDEDAFEPSPELEAPPVDASTLFAELGVVEDYRAVFVHGDKFAEHQKYIMLHDTEGWGSPQSVIDYWAGNGNLVAAHFIIGTDGSVYQCVPLDKIAHHAGFGNAGNNAAFGVNDESRDDKLGTVPIGGAHPDYGMNSYSIGIEMVHVGGGGEYPTAQLEALDRLIAYVDAYYGFESSIVAHNDWRSSNSDMSAEFAGFLSNYKDHRSYRNA